MYIQMTSQWRNSQRFHIILNILITVDPFW